MRNRIVGYMIIAFALAIGFIIYLFNRALTEIVSSSCTHGDTCPMWGSIRFHTNISIGVMILVLVIGLYMVFFADKPQKHKTEKDIDEKDAQENHRSNIDIKEKYESLKESLSEEERKIMDLIVEKEGTAFQSDIVDGTRYTKVKVTRILDKLEGRSIIERRRRGMTNVVIIKH